METTYSCNVVLDLEFTQIPKGRRVNGLSTEIIEIGAVKIAPDGTIAGEFSHMVKPTLASGVSRQVNLMTGIANEDLTSARPLNEVLEALSQWIGTGRARFVTWSKTDQKQIERECSIKGIDVELPSRWLDIQRIHPRLMGSQKKFIKLGDAADWCGIENDKLSAHRALYDAQITAGIFLMMKSGEYEAHRARVEAEMNKSTEAQACSSSIADRCGGLAGLFASLKAQEERAA